MFRLLTYLDFILVVDLDVRAWHHKDNNLLEHVFLSCITNSF